MCHARMFTPCLAQVKGPHSWEAQQPASALSTLQAAQKQRVNTEYRHSPWPSVVALPCSVSEASVPYLPLGNPQVPIPTLPQPALKSHRQRSPGGSVHPGHSPRSVPATPTPCSSPTSPLPSPPPSVRPGGRGRGDGHPLATDSGGLPPQSRSSEYFPHWLAARAGPVV